MDDIIINILVGILKEAKEPIFEWLREKASESVTPIDDFVVDKLEEFVEDL